MKVFQEESIVKCVALIPAREEVKDVGRQSQGELS